MVETQYRVYSDENVEKMDKGVNVADLIGCTIDAGQDIRHDAAKMKQCLLQCTDRSDCTGVTFHSMGTMLKKNSGDNDIYSMMKERKNFETYVKLSGDSCRPTAGHGDAHWCQTTCSTALQTNDIEAQGNCCWNDCPNRSYKKDQEFTCSCDGSKNSATLIV